MERITAVFESIVDQVSLELPGAELGNVKFRRAPKWLQRLWADKIHAVTFGSTVMFHQDVDVHWSDPELAELIAHELAHIRQWRQLGAGSFIIRYLSDYLSGRRKGLSHFDAYEAGELEVEARLSSKRFQLGDPKPD